MKASVEYLMLAVTDYNLANSTQESIDTVNTARKEASDEFITP